MKRCALRFAMYVNALMLLGFSCDPMQLAESSAANSGVDIAASEQMQASTCLPSDANAAVFNHAICLCGDLANVGNAVTSTSFSSYGTDARSSHHGNVGINGELGAVGNLDVDGALVVAGSARGIGNAQVYRSSSIAQNLGIISNLEIGEDLYVGGDLHGIGNLDVGGVTRVGGGVSFLGNLACVDVDQGVSLNIAAPCPCAPEQLIDVAAAVAAQRGAQPLSMPQGVGNAQVVLAGGDYYSDDASLFVGNIKWLIDSPTRLFIENDIELVGNGVFELAAGAELDLYVSGSIHSVGDLDLGDNSTASRAFRLYIGGSDTVHIASVGNTQINGSIYAPRADLSWVGNMAIAGSVFANELKGVGNLEVLYDVGLVGMGEDCPAEEGTTEGGSGVGSDAPTEVGCTGTEDDPCVDTGSGAGDDGANDDGAGDDGAGDDGAGDDGTGDDGTGDDGTGDDGAGDDGAGGSGDTGCQIEEGCY